MLESYSFRAWRKKCYRALGGSRIRAWCWKRLDFCTFPFREHGRRAFSAMRAGARYTAEPGRITLRDLRCPLMVNSYPNKVAFWASQLWSAPRSRRSASFCERARLAKSGDVPKAESARGGWRGGVGQSQSGQMTKHMGTLLAVRVAPTMR